MQGYNFLSHRRPSFHQTQHNAISFFNFPSKTQDIRIVGRFQKSFFCSRGAFKRSTPPVLPRRWRVDLEVCLEPDFSTKAHLCKRFQHIETNQSSDRQEGSSRSSPCPIVLVSQFWLIVAVTSSVPPRDNVPPMELSPLMLTNHFRNREIKACRMSSEEMQRG